MSYRSYAVAFSSLLFTACAVGQSAFVSLDTNPTNRCAKNGQGALWTLTNPKRNTTHPGETTATVVTLRRTDSSGNQPRDIAVTLSSGETKELECAQGNPGVTYQLLGQK